MDRIGGVVNRVLKKNLSISGFTNLPQSPKLQNGFHELEGKIGVNKRKCPQA